MTASIAAWYTLGTWSSIILELIGISVNAVGCRTSAVGPSSEVRCRRCTTTPGCTKKSTARWSRSSSPCVPSRSSQCPWHRASDAGVVKSSETVRASPPVLTGGGRAAVTGVCSKSCSGASLAPDSRPPSGSGPAPSSGRSLATGDAGDGSTMSSATVRVGRRSTLRRLAAALGEYPLSRPPSKVLKAFIIGCDGATWLSRRSSLRTAA